jgi:hypothetical protein
MKKRNDNFLITSEEYKSFVKYFSLISKKNILYIANKKITIFLIDNNISKIDLFLQNLEKNFINLYYLDFICRFFFKNTIIRYKLNLILALHEADYDNFNIILKNSLISLIIDLCIFALIAITVPAWILFIIIIRIFK